MSIRGCKKASVFASAILAYSGMALPKAYASDPDPKMDAGTIMTKMEPGRIYSYIAGVIEGLAMARYERDNIHVEGGKKTETGMSCIYAWFYDKPGAIETIYAAFEKYPRYPAGLVIYHLLRKECGE